MPNFCTVASSSRIFEIVLVCAGAGEVVNC